MSLDFEQLLKRNMGRIRRISERYAAIGESEDLSQEISMALWRSYKSFRGDASIETWLYRIAFNTAMTRVRKTIKDRQKNASFKQRHRINDSEPEGFSQADILANFLDSLNEIDASVLMMYLDGLNADEMEQVLGIKANAINVRVSRIKEKFGIKYVD